MAIRDPEDERTLEAVGGWFASERTAFEWLSRQIPALEGQTPREYARVHGVEALTQKLARHFRQ
jgi:hypothetical protein